MRKVCGVVAAVCMLALLPAHARAEAEPGTPATSFLHVRTALVSGEAWSLDCTVHGPIPARFALFDYTDVTGANGGYARSWHTAMAGEPAEFWGSVAEHRVSVPLEDVPGDGYPGSIDFSVSAGGSGAPAQLDLAVATWGAATTCAFSTSIGRQVAVETLAGDGARVTRLGEFRGPASAYATAARAAVGTTASLEHAGLLVGVLDVSEPFARRERRRARSCFANRPPTASGATGSRAPPRAARAGCLRCGPWSCPPDARDCGPHLRSAYSANAMRTAPLGMPITWAGSGQRSVRLSYWTQENAAAPAATAQLLVRAARSDHDVPR
jgi:hypothetical protein